MNKFNNIVHSIITEEVKVGNFHVIDKALSGKLGAIDIWNPGTDAKHWKAVGVTINGHLVVKDLESKGGFTKNPGVDPEEWEWLDLAAHAIENPTLSSIDVLFDKQPYRVNLMLFRDFLRNSLGFSF